MIIWLCSIGEKAILILAGNLNSGRSYLFTAVQLQTIQILTNDVQMLILCLSYFVTAVSNFYFIFKTGLQSDTSAPSSEILHTSRTFDGKSEIR